MRHNESPDLGATTALIKLTGEVNYESIRPIVAHITEELKNGHWHLVLDMREVTDLSSGALGSLLIEQTNAEQRGGDIVIAAPQDCVSEALRTNGFTDVFRVYKSTEHACRALEGGASAA